MSRPGRNDPCPCGSGKKYKQCCLAGDGGRAPKGQTPAKDSLLWRQATELHRAGRLGEAEVLYRRLLAVAPDDPEVLYPLGQLYNQAGRCDEAVACLQRAIVVNPRHARACNTLGMALEELGRLDEALDCYRKAVRLDTRGFEARYNLGGALLNAGLLDEAVVELERAVEIDPGRGLAQMTLGQALIRRGEVARAWPLLEQALARMPDRPLVHDLYLFALNYLSDDPARLLDAHRAYGMRIEAPHKASWPVHRNGRDPERRLRIGYVSPDFREHSVATFLEPVLAHHDRAGFEIHAYYTAPLRDAMTVRIEALVDAWAPSGALDDARLAARIAADGIDILVDLAGHTTGNRLPVFARRPAPVQVGWLGYPATTGLTAIDWRLVTAMTDPPGAEAWHTEGLWRLPRTLWSWCPDPEAPAVDPLAPVRRNGNIRLLSANNIAKLSDATIAAWSRILVAVPDATLTLTGVPDGRASQHLHERFRAQGIAPHRVVIPGKLPQGAYRALLADVDIALDPFPYNGTTTSCDALWAGLPLVTLAGRASAARSGTALLGLLGLESLVAEDIDGYVRIATALACDVDRMESLRAGLRDRISASALRDEAGFARDLEAAYRGMWRAWCAAEGGPVYSS